MNILFITADQFRADCLSSKGHSLVKTPHLDLLAQEGISFNQHYAQTTPCAPSRTSLHTGMYMHNHRCVSNGTPVEKRFTNWALEVRKLGFDPTLFGYTDTAVDPRGLSPEDTRLTHYSEPLPGIGYFTPIKDEVNLPWVKNLVSKGYAIPPVLWDLYGNTKTKLKPSQCKQTPLPLAIKAEDHETKFIVDQCIGWIRGQQNPWITHLSLMRPHPPYVAPEPYNAMYAVADINKPIRRNNQNEEAQQHPLLNYYIQHEKFGDHLSELELKQAIASYYGLITEVDDNLGRLFAELKALGQWDNTLIIFTSDHGDQLGDHWLLGKLGYFDASYHIPLIIRDPLQSADSTRGSVVDSFSENIDIMPTILNWLNTEIPSQCDGFSLLPFLRNKSVPNYWRNEVHWEFDFRDIITSKVEHTFGLSSHQCTLNVIKDKWYKYVHFTALPPLLFNLKEDPNELNNLAMVPSYQPILLEYAQKMLSWRMNHDDRALTETMLTSKGPIVKRSPLHPPQ